MAKSIKIITLTAVLLQALIGRTRLGLDSTWRPSACPAKTGRKISYFRKLLFRPFFCFKCHFKGHRNDLIDYNWPVVSGTCSPSPVDSVQLSVCSGHEYHQEQALRLTWLKTLDDPHNHSCQCHTYRFNYTNPMPSNQQFGLVQKRPSSMTEGWRGKDGRKRNGKFRDLVTSLKKIACRHHIRTDW